MAIAGSGGWKPSVRVSIIKRKMVLASIAHNVPPSVARTAAEAALEFKENPKAFPYVNLREGGGTGELYVILVKIGLIDDPIGDGKAYLMGLGIKNVWQDTELN